MLPSNDVNSRLIFSWYQLYFPSSENLKNIKENFNKNFHEYYDYTDFVDLDFHLFLYSFCSRYDLCIMTASDFMNETIEVASSIIDPSIITETEEYTDPNIRNILFNTALPIGTIISNDEKFQQLGLKTSNIKTPLEMVKMFREKKFPFISIQYVNIRVNDIEINYDRFQNETIKLISKLNDFESNSNGKIKTYLFMNLGKEEFIICTGSTYLSEIEKLSQLIREIGYSVYTIPTISEFAMNTNIFWDDKFSPIINKKDDKIFPQIGMRVIPGSESCIKNYLKNDLLKKLFDEHNVIIFDSLGNNDIYLYFPNGIDSYEFINLFFNVKNKGENLIENINNYIQRNHELTENCKDTNFVIGTETIIQFDEKNIKSSNPNNRTSLKDENFETKELNILKNIYNDFQSNVEYQKNWSKNIILMMKNLLNVQKMIVVDKRNINLYYHLFRSMKGLILTLNIIENFKRINVFTAKDDDDILSYKKYSQFKIYNTMGMNIIKEINEIINYKILQVNILSSDRESSVFHQGCIIGWLHYWELYCQTIVRSLIDGYTDNNFSDHPYFILLSTSNTSSTICRDFYHLGFVYASPRKLFDIKLSYFELAHDSSENFIRSAYSNKLIYQTSLDNNEFNDISEIYLKTYENNPLLIHYSFEGFVDALAYLASKDVLGRNNFQSALIYWHSIWKFFDRLCHNFKANVDTNKIFLDGLSFYFLRRIIMRIFSDYSKLETLKNEIDDVRKLYPTIYSEIINEELEYFFDFFKYNKNILETASIYIVKFACYLSENGNLIKSGKTNTIDELFELSKSTIKKFIINKINDEYLINDIINGFVRSYVDLFELDKWVKNLSETEPKINIWDKNDDESLGEVLERDDPKYLQVYNNFIKMIMNTNEKQLYG